MRDALLCRPVAIGTVGSDAILLLMQRQLSQHWYCSREALLARS
jgi:hypothetical protein